VNFDALIAEPELESKAEIFFNPTLTVTSRAREVGPADWLIILMEIIQVDEILPVTDRAWNHFVLRGLARASAFFALHISEEFRPFPV
jgi:hypothetical protein